MIQARAHRDWARQRIFVVVRDTDTGMIFGPDRIFQPADFEHGQELPVEAYALIISERYFEQVLAALNEVATSEKAPGDAYALRRDLDHEKERVDKMLEVLIAGAMTPPLMVNQAVGQQGPPGPQGAPGPVGPPGPPGHPGYGPDGK